MSVYHQFKNGKEVKKKHLALIGVIFGLITYPVLPLGFKFFSFIIPVILLSIIWSSKYDNFNIHIFFMCLFISFLLPSNAFIFDARNVYGSSVNNNAFLVGIYHFLDIACIIIMAIPFFLITVVVIAVVRGDASKATTGFARFLMVVGFTIFIFYIFDLAGIELGGITGTILEFYADLLTFMLKLPLIVYDIANLLSFGLLPKLPSGYDSDIKFDMTDNTYGTAKSNFNALGYSGIILTISDLLPVFAMFMCFITFLLFYDDERAERIEIWITKISADYICPKCGSPDLDILERNSTIELLCNNDKCPYYVKRKNNRNIRVKRYHGDPVNFKKPKIERKFYPNVDFSILIVFCLLIFGSFMIFLSYSNYFESTFDASLMWRYIGFFGVYLPMAFIPLLIMLLSDKFYYKRSNLIETTKGIMYGYFGLWLLTRLFFTRKVMSAYSVQGIDISLGLAYLLEQSLYVGPAETLFFTCFLGSIVATFLQSYTKKNLERGFEEDRLTQIQIKESEEKVYERFEIGHKTDIAILDEDIHYTEATLQRKNLKKKEKQDLEEKLTKLRTLREKTIQDLQTTQKNIRETKEHAETLKNERDVAIISEDSIFGRAGSAMILFIFGMIIPAFLFASVHSIVNLNRVDFMLFWTSGFGVYYFAGGVWFSFIYFKWGWKPAVLVHILFNISDILLFFAFMGV